MYLAPTNHLLKFPYVIPNFTLFVVCPNYYTKKIQFLICILVNFKNKRLHFFTIRLDVTAEKGKTLSSILPLRVLITIHLIHLQQMPILHPFQSVINHQSFRHFPIRIVQQKYLVPLLARPLPEHIVHRICQIFQMKMYE